MNSLPSVFLVLLNWNGWTDTIQCLASIAQQDYCTLTVIVVDNGSTDGSVRKIREAAPEALLIENAVNLGFSAGCNVGIRHALERGADYIWLLNNDTIVTTNALRDMVELAESDRTIGAVGSVIYHMDGDNRLQAWGGGRINLWTGRSCHLHASGELHYITGASMLLPARAIRRVGLLDESFFLYWDDCDMSLRLRGAGYRITVASQSIIYHKESATVGKRTIRQDRMFSESTVRFCRKHAPIPLLAILIAVGGRSVKRLLTGRPASAAAVLQGAWQGWLR